MCDFQSRSGLRVCATDAWDVLVVTDNNDDDDDDNNDNDAAV